jgi:DnaJ family protein A protein 2
MEPGDIIIVLQQQEHDRFVRKGSDLFTEQTVNLVEALAGFELLITHLDGRQLLVRSKPGEVLTPNAIKCIDNEGFPIYRRPFEKGRLIIKFNIEFPKAALTTNAAALEALLGQTRRVPTYTEGEVDECDLKDLDPSAARSSDDGRREEAYDDGDDEGGGPRQAQCAMGGQ